MVPVYRRVSNQHLLFDPSILSDIDPSFFDAAQWRRRDAVFGGAEGRGTALFVSHGGDRFVLRHYKRGGMFSKWVSETYLWRGLNQSRAWREWLLLNRMVQEGLPVPRPVAARVVREGWRYRADLVTLFLADCFSLARRFRMGSATPALWMDVGRTIRRFHDAGYDHADLNAHNILIQSRAEGSEKVYLVDFDRGRRRTGARAWKTANLKRLRGSILKLARPSPSGMEAEVFLQACLEGYHKPGRFGP